MVLSFSTTSIVTEKVHTNFSQILDTGRVSSSKPNMQQIPSDNTFRNCFVTEPGWVFVSSDYSSQELNVIAYGSQDPVWLDALERGLDLHGVCADLVFEDKWRHAGADEEKLGKRRSKRSTSDSPTAWDRSSSLTRYKSLKEKRKRLLRNTLQSFQISGTS